MKNKLTLTLCFIILHSSFILSASAQSTAFTYQGRVLDNGTNFSGAGLFKFALVTSTNFSHQATATANLSGQFVTSYSLISGGNGYVSAPAVTITGGGGSGATATTTISGGVVTAVNPVSAGSGYTSTPTVTIAAPPANISYITYWSNDGTSSAGSQPASSVSVTVTNGVFTVVLGDTTLANMTAISASLFTQPNLQLRIWFNDGVNGFAALSPLQNLTPTPYAVFANSASNAVNATTAITATTATTATTASAVGASGVNTVAIQNNAVTAAKIASGQVVKNLNGLQDGVTLSAGNNVTITPSGQTLTIAATGGQSWSLTGNSGTTPGTHFVGTTDNQPLELRVNGARGLRLEPGITPNVIAGRADNSIASGVSGGAIGGGAANTIASGANVSFIGGGFGNTIQDSAYESVIGGGHANTIAANAFYSVIPGGRENVVTAPRSFAAGTFATANHTGTFVWGDFSTTTTSTANNQFMIRCSGGAIFYTGTGTGTGVTLGANATSWATLSDKNMKKDIESVNFESVLDKLARVPVKQWHYKWEAGTDTLNIGPMAQDFKAAFYPGRDDKSITTLEFDGVELAAIQGLNEKLKAKDTEIQNLKQQNNSLEKRLRDVEQTVRSLAGK